MEKEGQSTAAKKKVVSGIATKSRERHASPSGDIVQTTNKRVSYTAGARVTQPDPVWGDPCLSAPVTGLLCNAGSSLGLE